MTIEGRRDAPHTSLSKTELGLLFNRVFVQSVGRVGDDGVKAAIGLLLNPIEAVGMK